MKAIYRNLLLCISVIGCALSAHAQPLERPIIWITQGEKAGVLENIENHPWAQSLFSELKSNLESTVNTHAANPQATLDTIPSFAETDHQYSDAKALVPAKAHNTILANASNAGLLYFLTGEEKYAQFTADILNAYIERVAPRTPETTTICGNAFYDARATYGPFAIAYDFTYHFLNTPGRTVYSKSQNGRVPFDNSQAQKAIANMVGNILQEYGKPDKHGKIVSNHPILTATGALFGILCIDDEAERERLFDVFWEKGTHHQNSFKNTILPMFGEQGIWPESLSYSFMAPVSLVLNVVDRVKPEMDVTSDYMHIFEGNFLFDSLRAPNRVFVRFGDSKRYNDSTDELYRYTLSFAQRRGHQQLKQKAQVALRQAHDAKGGYQPSLSNSTFNNMDPLQLLWGTPIPDSVDGAIAFNTPTVILEHAGIALQRNHVAADNATYGLCGIIGGAHYVHSHVTGISMELYGAGYMMAANAGMPHTLADRKGPEHRDYYRLHAGNNTVIVNGTSHGIQEGSWNSDSHLWQDTTVNIAAEPKHLEAPVNEHYSFATQYLEDTINKAQQQRTLAIVRTSPTTAFYFDLFRSRSLVENKFHDYVYHNIGDETLISDNTGTLTLAPTDRYDNDIGDPVGSPGWRYFEEERATAPTSKAIKVQFNLNHDRRSMHLFVPDGVTREYTHALAPPTREAKNGYIKKKTQTIAIRQQGEAWKRPFIAILEPSATQDSSIVSVTQLTQDDRVVGAKVVSKVNGQSVTNYIICQDQADATYTDNTLELSFTGRFAIVTDRGNEDVELYIGEGSQLAYRSHRLASQSAGKTAASSRSNE